MSRSKKMTNGIHTKTEDPLNGPLNEKEQLYVIPYYEKTNLPNGNNCYMRKSIVLSHCEPLEMPDDERIVNSLHIERNHKLFARYEIYETIPYYANEKLIGKTITLREAKIILEDRIGDLISIYNDPRTAIVIARLGREGRLPKR
jgi:hypothetical protein